MKAYKKVMCVSLALICGIGISNPLGAMAEPEMGAADSAAAVIYDPCDVNHDGKVTTDDASYILEHLSGGTYYTNYNQLDANQSHTVDVSDAECVLQEVATGLFGGKSDYKACYMKRDGKGNLVPATTDEKFPSKFKTPYKLDSSVSQTNQRSYRGYSYIKKADIPTYTLNCSSYALTSEAVSEQQKIIGTDGRIISKGEENTGIVRLRDHGTGFIVGDHEIATVAHCVVDKDTCKIIKDIVLDMYGTNGEPNGKTLSVAEIHVPASFDPHNSGGYDDYALITVKEDLSSYFHFELGSSYNMINTTDDGANSIPLHVTGVPSSNKKIGNGSTLYTHNDSLLGNDNATILHYYTDTYFGQSGSPVYTITRVISNNKVNYVYTALAIHSGGDDGVQNYGALITKYQFKFYKDNAYAHYK